MPQSHPSICVAQYCSETAVWVRGWASICVIVMKIKSKEHHYINVIYVNAYKNINFPKAFHTFCVLNTTRLEYFVNEPT